ncbi:hypothetical protein M422DRAFT_243690 [Sphaerobolus stellatus SS14]|nr:hypothetical protein M422DRAFT_243690 [Sphaerobolus stellatus SS14]
MPQAFHIHFAPLKIEYHYLRLIYVTHSLLTICYAISITQVSNQPKASIWSWSVRGNKAAHRVLELGTSSGRRQDSTPSASNPTSSPTSPSLPPSSTLPTSTPPKRPFALNPPKHSSSPSPLTGSTQWSSSLLCSSSDTKSQPMNLGVAVPY